MHKRHFFGRPVVLATLAACGLAVLAAQALTGQEEEGPPNKAKVYVYPKKLTTKDKLSFGPGKDQKETIPIKAESTLVYVDLAPDARFAHGTQCILISAEGATIIKGEWWLVLNGEALFRDAKTFKVDFPIDLSGK
jgi:hypothetical protein